MTADAKVAARIMRELDKLTAKHKREQERRKAADKALADQAAALIVEGARAGMPRVGFIGRPYSNARLSKLYRDFGLNTRTKDAAPSGRTTQKEGTKS